MNLRRRKSFDCPAPRKPTVVSIMSKLERSRPNRLNAEKIYEIVNWETFGKASISSSIPYLLMGSCRGLHQTQPSLVMSYWSTGYHDSTADSWVRWLRQGRRLARRQARLVVTSTMCVTSGQSAPCRRFWIPAAVSRAPATLCPQLAISLAVGRYISSAQPTSSSHIHRCRCKTGKPNHTASSLSMSPQWLEVITRT